MSKTHFQVPTSKDSADLQEALTEYNIQIVPSLPKTEIYRLDFVLKDERGKLIGGINAEYVNWGILFTSLLFVDSKYRSHGYGSQLLEHVEKLAIEKGCYLAHTDTLEFQAKDSTLSTGMKCLAFWMIARKDTRGIPEKEPELNLRP